MWTNQLARNLPTREVVMISSIDEIYLRNFKNKTKYVGPDRIGTEKRGNKVEEVRSTDRWTPTIF